MPGADAIKRLMTLDAKIKKTRAGMKEHMAKEEEVRKWQCSYMDVCASVVEWICVPV